MQNFEVGKTQSNALNMAVPFREWAWVVAPPLGGKRVLAVIVSYLDASNTQVDVTKISAVAGYIAEVEEWERVTAEWQALLSRFNIPHFHLAETRHLVGKAWAEDCVNLFSQVIRDSKVAPIGAAVHDMDWHYPDWGDMQTKRLGNPYEQCLDLSFELIGQFANEHYPEESISIVCDADASKDRIQAIFSDRAKEFPTFQRITIERGDNKPMPLQCADLGVGLFRKSWISIFDENADIPWGEMPQGRKGLRSFWSLRGGLLIKRVFDSIQRKNANRSSPSSEKKKKKKPK